ncbi:sugar isomerase SIS [Candidatus Vecturithrix granuli]|uniref:Sugar isomerase SIS n=1 Tax=Vecturithrix granuli TaxID=1499967 RepID=A0A081C764_VECG1|nr:sugar isomerase SIS [Candidatus Vecturithrix granuli]
MNTQEFDLCSQPTDVQNIYHDIQTHYPEEAQLLQQLLQKNQQAYTAILPEFLRAYHLLVTGFQAKHRLFLCGNGGSLADAMHISGELLKSFKRRRSLSQTDKSLFSQYEYGDILAEYLEYGFPCTVLGLNHALFSAVQNDCKVEAVQYAQELYALGIKGDMLLAISTSGNALNVLYAITAAKVLGVKTIGFTGHIGGKLAQYADIAIKAPETSTESIQEHHIVLYHALCALLESRFFPRDSLPR